MGHRGHGDELSVVLERALTERGVDRENFTLAHVANHPSLRDRIAFVRDDDVDVEHFTWSGVAQVLRRGPHAWSVGGAFHRRDRGTESATTEEKATARGVSLMNRHVPAAIVMGAFKTEKRSSIHATIDPTQKRLPASDPSTGPGIGSLHG